MRFRIALPTVVFALVVPSTVVFAVDVVPFESSTGVSDELRAIDPELVTKFETGTHYLVSDKYPAAVTWLETVLDQAPGFDIAVRRYGRAKFELGEREEGLSQLTLAYGLNPRPGTAFWLAMARWRCVRDGGPCARQDDLNTIVPLALEAFGAYPAHGNALELAIGTTCEFGGTAAVDEFLAGAMAPGGEVVSARRNWSKRDVGFPSLTENDRACFHHAFAVVLGAAERDTADERLRQLVEMISNFRGASDSPDAPRAAMWLLERRFDGEPDTGGRGIEDATKRIASKTDDPEIALRGLRLLVRAEEGARAGDSRLMGTIQQRATSYWDEEVLRGLIKRIDEHLESRPDDKQLLIIQAKAAHAVSDWITLARVASKLDELDPDATRPNLAEDLLAGYDGPRVGIQLMRAWADGEGTWLRRILAVVAGILVALAFLFGLYRLATAVFGADRVAPMQDDDDSTDTESEDRQSGMIVLGQADAPRWPRTVAVIEVVGATLVVVVGTFLAGFGIGSGPLARQVPEAVLIGVALVVYAVLIFVVGLVLRYSRCRRPETGGSRESRVVSGVVFGLVLVGASMIAATVQGLVGVEPKEQQWIVDLAGEAGLTLVVLQILGILLIPAAEEMFFRGYVFERLRQGGGLILAYLVSALLFAVVHMNPAATGLYLVQGVVLAAAYRHRNSILTAAVAHTVNNAVVFGLMSLAG